MKLLRDEIRFYLLVFVGMMEAVLIGWGTWGVLQCVDSHPHTEVLGQEKVFQRTLAEDLKVGRYGLHGIDLIKCGICRLEKRRNGVLTFGGFNILVLEDLSVVLPPVDDAGEERKCTVGDADVSREVVKRMGVSPEFLRRRGLGARFSGLRISRMTVGCVSDGGKKMELLFTAHSAESDSKGLTLSGCEIFDASGSCQKVGKAVLTLSGGSLNLRWSGGELDLASRQQKTQQKGTNS